MARNNYSMSTIDHIIKANTKLLDEKKDLERQLLEKDKIINKIIEVCNYQENGILSIKIKSIIEGKEDEEDEDIFSII